MSDGPSRIDRSKDLYRVHDASKKQKKDRKAGEEHEFLDLLEESDRNLEEFEQEKPKKEGGPAKPPATKSLLAKLSAFAPPIQVINDAGDKKGGGK